MASTLSGNGVAASRLRVTSAPTTSADSADTRPMTFWPLRTSAPNTRPSGAGQLQRHVVRITVGRTTQG